MPYVSQMTDPDYLEMLDAERRPTTSEQVAEFHTAFKVPPLDFYNPDDRRFRFRLLMEEFKEVAEALGISVEISYESNLALPLNQANFLKELCDLKYVTDGAAIAFNMDIDTAFDRVHASNMSKLDENGRPIFRHDGKVLKGPNYKEPDLGDLT